ncbi:hypothetical protein Vadar_022120 [Vaccinium darrowii]|uniref:Uncharacterized protein n=1 Tax=Vaccinium darrowii TaxID=229202 RepID=A0ACB7Y853_9ERIC|nr:hypothetical protein Vadar_022120 [Vaccinium darrowii]
MPKNPEKSAPSGPTSVRSYGGRYYARNSDDCGSSSPVKTWKGKDSLEDGEELMLDVSFKGSGDSTDESGPISFSGASHPPEPIDTALMRPVCVSIGQSKSEGKCLVKSVSMKGPFLEDLSIRVSGFKPSSYVLTPSESLIEEQNDLGAVISSPSVPRPSQNTENNLLPPVSEEKECVWDASLPPSGNVSPQSSIASSGVVTAMSIVNSCSTYGSDWVMSDGMLSVDRNCGSGDLHTLRQRQPGKHFSEYAARFYAAEVLLALECSTPPEIPGPVDCELPGKFAAVDPVGLGSKSKRMVGTEVKSGGNFLDFEFF